MFANSKGNSTFAVLLKKGKTKIKKLFTHAIT